MANDYGYFGSGSTGYAHYKQSFDRNFGGSGGSGGNHNGGGNGSGCGPLLLIIVVYRHCGRSRGACAAVYVKGFNNGIRNEAVNYKANR